MKYKCILRRSSISRWALVWQTWPCIRNSNFYSILASVSAPGVPRLCDAQGQKRLKSLCSCGSSAPKSCWWSVVCSLSWQNSADFRRDAVILYLQVQTRSRRKNNTLWRHASSSLRAFSSAVLLVGGQKHSTAQIRCVWVSINDNQKSLICLSDI